MKHHARQARQGLTPEEKREQRNNPLLILKRKMDAASAAGRVASNKLRSLRGWLEDQKRKGVDIDFDFDADTKKVISDLLVELEKHGYRSDPGLAPSGRPIIKGEVKE